MLKYIENPQKMTLEEARRSILSKKAIFVVNDMTDMSNICGYINYISESSDSYDSLIEKYNALKRSKEQVMIIGSYENGGVVGVQYEGL